MVAQAYVAGLHLGGLVPVGVARATAARVRTMARTFIVVEREIDRFDVQV